MDQKIYPNSLVGKFVNEKFISIKLQFDKTEKDNEQVKSMYATVEAIDAQYKIRAFPTFLFFFPDGELVYRETGYKDIEKFMAMTQTVLDPVRLRVKYQIAEYKRGIRDYANLPILIEAALKVYDDTITASIMAEDYMRNFLNNLNGHELVRTEHLEFIRKYSAFIQLDDNLFRFLYKNSEEIDSIMKKNDFALSVIRAVITNKLLEKKLTANGQPKFTKPKWQLYIREINSKYPKINAAAIVTQFQVRYYWSIDHNCQKWANSVSKKIKYSKILGGWDSYFQLNDPAWKAFLECNSRSVLKAALKWSQLSIDLKAGKDVEQELDTKANLLYKLGRVEKAIQVERMALDAAQRSVLSAGKSGNPEYLKEFETNLFKMLNKLPTWPDDKAQ